MAHIHEQLSNEQNQTVQTMAQSLRQEGREEVQKSVALNMLKKNMSISLIADVTGLSITEVKALQKEKP
ncbi:MAG: hypothetical protein AAGB12_13995 [Pseudomonadota bacterium]